MTYAGNHMLLQWGGTFRGGTQTSPAHEIFSGSLRFFGPGIESANNDQTLGALAVTLGRYFGKTTAQIPSNAYLELVKWNLIGTDGRYVEENTRSVSPVGFRGGSANQYPHQVAWVTTWGTDVQRGKASRGRTFWPTSASIDGETGHVPTATCQAKAQADAELIVDLNAAARSGVLAVPIEPVPAWLQLIGYDPGYTPRPEVGIVAGVMSKIGSGISRAILTAEVGDRLDVQRRRGNGMSDRRVAVDIGG